MTHAASSPQKNFTLLSLQRVRLQQAPVYNVTELKYSQQKFPIITSNV